jgi:hypothetical protein
MRPRRLLTVGLVCLVWAGACRAPGPPPSWLGEPEPIAPGIDLFRTADSTLVESQGPIAAYLLRLDPARVRLQSALAGGAVMGAARVDEIAARAGAIAAINGGYFNISNGEPVGLLKVEGELVSDIGTAKGAVLIHSVQDGSTELAFDQIAARMTMRFEAAGRTWVVPIDGVDTTRVRGKLMLYTPAYQAHTDTAPNGTEWVLTGEPLRVVDIQSNVGRARIPRDGVALSFGGLDLPEPLAALTVGVDVALETTWKTSHGLPETHLDAADHIVGGAGLLRSRGTVLDDWTSENLSRESFVDERHPRTLIGRDARGQIWLAAVDGRQPDYSIGMAFRDLQRLCDRLELTDALNLDGGGSTTMVVNGRIANRPSDPLGPRAVSDAIVVMLAGH